MGGSDWVSYPAQRDGLRYLPYCQISLFRRDGFLGNMFLLTHAGALFVFKYY